MATSKEPGGLYHVKSGDSYITVDAHGKEIEGAPKRRKDTPPHEQPGSSGVGALSAEERQTVTLANAMRVASGKKPLTAAELLGGKSQDEDEDTETEDERLERLKKTGTRTSDMDGRGAPETVTLDQLGTFLQGIDDPKVIRKMQKRDDRSGAQKLYEDRLEELKG